MGLIWHHTHNKQLYLYFIVFYLYVLIMPSKVRQEGLIKSQTQSWFNSLASGIFRQ